MQNHYENFIQRFALFIILFAAITLIGYFIIDGRATDNQNNGYVRVINCIISVPANTRTKDDINNCYVEVETDLGIKLERYNNHPN